MAEEAIGIGLIGLGTVGQGVVKLLHEQAELYAQRVGRQLVLRKALVRDTAAKRSVKLAPGIVTTNPDELFNDPGVGIVVEVAGGVDVTGDYVRRALQSGRHVVTANKALLARHGHELFALAREHGVSIAFEASCGGGIPILSALKFGLAANRIDAVYGILNGTCNYILTQMTERGATYAAALQDAQRLGFAEADPSMDVTGADAAQKLAIVASLAFGVGVRESDVTHEGIDNLQVEDIHFAGELGYKIKLLAVGQRINGGLVLRIYPAFVPEHDPLAQVHDAFNALSVFGHAVGHTMFYGHGAGQMPTASAVVSDILNVAGGWYPHAFKTMKLWPDQHEAAQLANVDGVLGRYYLRIDVKDEPGVLAQIARILGDHRISISAVLQHEPEAEAKPTSAGIPVIVTTYEASEGAMRDAAKQIAQLEAVNCPPMVIRILRMPRG